MWKNKLNIDIETEDFMAYFININKVTKYTKLQSFQFRLLHCAIITNIDLHKWKIFNSPSCTFCKQENESIIHLLIQCPISYTIWNEIMKWLRNSSITFEIDTKKILLN